MKPPPWDTSVFVPKSSQIAALIALGRVAPPSPFPSPPPHDSRSRWLGGQDPLSKKHLLKVLGGRPSAKNAIRARTT